MNNKIGIEEGKEMWNDPAPELSPLQMMRAYDHIDSFIRHRRVREGAKIGVCAFSAAILCFVSALIGSRLQPQAEVVSPTYVDYVARSGEMKTITLSDGTIVHLNSQSTLCCSEVFSGPTREVFIFGEGFFEVAKDPDHPFIVHAAGNSIRVTGTKFNVRAFLDEKVCTTTLLEGSIEVSVPGQRTPISLTPGRALSIGDEGNIQLFNIDAEIAIGWYRGEFNAYHKTLDEICRDLERRFSIKIMIANERITSKIYYASFVNNEDIDSILNALNVEKDFRIRKQDDFYYIY